MQVLCGIDIGGTKCAISLGTHLNNTISILDTLQFKTNTENFALNLAMIMAHLENLLEKHAATPRAIGITCGGPLDRERGYILSPPNLKRWGDVDIITPFKHHFSVPVSLRNDADACTLAEWKLGSGRDHEHMVFLTFGTGMGAGMILGGQLYTGFTGLAGEVGHIRIAENGPLGHGKYGSFEGFCSGGGIAYLARERAKESISKGYPPLFCPDLSAINAIDAKSVADACRSGDRLAIEIMHTVGTALGKGISIIIDMLNIPLIVIGSIYVRQMDLLKEPMWKAIHEEALSESAQHCTIVPAGLGEDLGNYAALYTALEGANNAN